ncbi:hypothetical protein BJ875DRAFT_215235 [Amylocarpus encephaloides]|uniref:Uncharacterized protein n=1 Tax=Amylocarpus encephaloides TaxID=45428 RepID=A0A9P7YMR0_9HELO|nr:hypothetical protein BJ875DRAFT_215235 [Amylocarpus encephaloides]
MVNIKDIRASNAQLKGSKEFSTPVAVFVGATSGIGMGTLKQFVKQTTSPKAYIVGRSKGAATPLLDELKTSNGSGTLIFLETEISLMKNVDQICDEIKAQENKVDLLFMSPGYLTFEGRNDSSEGLDIPHALRLYTRLRFVHNLLPLLESSSTPRVISILAGGKESSIDLTDLELRKSFDARTAMKLSTTQTTLAFEELANSHPSVAFIHKYPGFVNTGAVPRLLKASKGIWIVPATFIRLFVVPVLNLLAMTVDEAGERGLFLSTSAAFPPAEATAGMSGVPLPTGVEVAKDSEVKGLYLLGGNDESAAVTPGLAELRAQGGSKLVWESVLAVWERALQRSG